MSSWQFLLVDDDDISITLLSDALQYAGISEHKIDYCVSGQEALDTIRSHPHKYNVVITDLNMPNMDGMELIRRLNDVRFDGRLVIVSEMHPRIIELAADLANFHHSRLIANIRKPVNDIDIEQLLERLDLFESRTTYGQNAKLTEDELINAISSNRIEPYYQPKVYSDSMEVHGVEALARIVPEDNSQPVILPYQFIPTAEEHNLTNLITYQLLEKAARDYLELSQHLGTHFNLAINLSPQQLGDLQCPDNLDVILSHQQITHGQINLEVTENEALRTLQQLETLNRLGIRGYGISLDDFGTGFTNIQQLRRLPFTEVKIDRSLIKQIHEDRFSQVVVNSLAEIAQELQLSLVAEGIETQDELNYLHDKLPPLLLQGYLITHPLPKEQLIDWHNQWKTK